MSEILEKIKQMTEPLLEGSDMFIVNIKIKPINNIKLFLDADAGLPISKSASVNRKLYPLIEESGIFPEGDFSLEVSSPGVDEPLLLHRQYVKNIGRTVLVTLLSEGNPEVLGVLKHVDEEKITLDVKQGKKKEVTVQEIPFSNIKSTVVQIIF
jgi:ribosome maturation factor RimP